MNATEILFYAVVGAGAAVILYTMTANARRCPKCRRWGKRKTGRERASAYETTCRHCGHTEWLPGSRRDG